MVRLGAVGLGGVRLGVARLGRARYGLRIQRNDHLRVVIAVETPMAWYGPVWRGAVRLGGAW
jgi:hypothetical protein